MNRTHIAVLVALLVLQTPLFADGIAGIYTVCYYGGSQNPDDSIVCYGRVSGGSWSRITTGWTEWQNWLPTVGQLRWGSTLLGNPKIVLDTNKYYVFYAKSNIPGVGWRYSDLSSQFFYAHTDERFDRDLNLTRTTAPSPPSSSPER